MGKELEGQVSKNTALFAQPVLKEVSVGLHDNQGNRVPVTIGFIESNKASDCLDYVVYAESKFIVTSNMLCETPTSKTFLRIIYLREEDRIFIYDKELKALQSIEI